MPHSILELPLTDNYLHFYKKAIDFLFEINSLSYTLFNFSK